MDKPSWDDIKQVGIIIGIVAMGIIAACYQNWTLVGTFATGGFALLNMRHGASAPN